MKKLRNSQSVKSLCAGLLLVGVIASTCKADLSGWITFTLDDTGAAHIWAVRADGTGLTQLVNMPGKQLEPAWSPDSRKIVYTTGSGAQVWVYDWASKTNAKIYDGDDYGGQAYVGTAAWSPDGRRILFFEQGLGDHHLTVISADGTGRAVVPVQGSSPRGPSWSPSGTAFAYDSPDGLWLYDFTATGDILRGTNRQLLADRVTDPDWGLNSKIVFGTSAANLATTAPGQSPDWTDPAHATVTLLTNDASWPFHHYAQPTWSPDESHLVYARLTTDGAVDLWTMDFSTLTQTRLTTLGGYSYYPDWGNPDAVPLPGAVLLGCLGLGTAVGVLRRRRTT